MGTLGIKMALFWPELNVTTTQELKVLSCRWLEGQMMFSHTLWVLLIQLSVLFCNMMECSEAKHD
ncbi:unnamed protein product [Prunus armeniaca]|uniref:Uncharacterized protein n=1 Tax=Prunus armeniaca TaxID=36596 RepID=A0A6J5Y4G3_PRUAR|nr:unnamed protein product [Prunus armeniaca]